MIRYRILAPLAFVVIFPFHVGCGTSASTNIFSAVHQVAVDGTNDRAFFPQTPRELFAVVASTLEGIGDQPLVSEDQNTTVFDLMPSVVTGIAVYGDGTTSRLFILGEQTDEDGNTVFNRVLVLEFDGTTISTADFSPITLSDGDESTDETDNSFAAIHVDPDNALVYVTDATAGKLYVLDATDGTTAAGPFDIAGTPQGMSLADGHLYVCNSSDKEAEQVITVFSIPDFSTTTIDVNAPCRILSVKSGNGGTVLLVKRSDAQRVLIRAVNTATFAEATAIASGTEGIADGELSSGAGITSSVNDLVTVRTSDGELFAYLPEVDGNIQFVDFASDLSSFTLETISTTVLNITQGRALADSSGDATAVLMAAQSGAVLSIEAGTSSVTVQN